MREVRTTYQPRRYRHLPTVVEGIPYDGSTESAEAIMAWAPGKFIPDDYGRLCSLTPEGLRYVHEGSVAMLDVEGLPYSVRPAIIEACHIEVGGEDHRAVLSVDQVRQLRASAELATDPRALREMLAQLAASHEAQRHG